ncbi:MAG: peptidase [Lachnospiraceae bacterium]|nr:peptidase [Lachnospiraceae bacterium]
MFDTIKEVIDRILSKRLVPILVIYLILFVLLIDRLLSLQIIDVDTYEKEAMEMTKKTREIKAVRGNIYDCNGKLLAYNQLSYNVVLQDYGSLSDMSSDEKNKVIFMLISILEKNGDELDVDFYIEFNKKGKLKFNIEGNELLRFKAEVFGLAGGVNDLTEEQTNMTAEDIFDYLREEPNAATTSFGIGPEFSDEDALKIMAVRYAIFINRYKEFESIIIAKNVSDLTVAAVKEYSDTIPGVDITEDTKRMYNKSKYFAHILGYTGTITSEKLKEAGEDSDYSQDDQIGLSGIEEKYEDYLKGKKGKDELVVEAMSSRVVSVSSVEMPEAGDNVYLTIDSKLQIECYKLLEEHLAGILISKITNGNDAGTRGKSASDIKIPIYDVYNALFENNVINCDRFTEKNSSKLEKKVYKKFKEKRKKVIKKLKKDLSYESKVIPKDIGETREDYIDFFYDFLADNNILLLSEIDVDDETYNNYYHEKLSLSKFIQYAINMNWLDLSCLNLGEAYYSNEEIYEKLLDYSFKQFKKDKSFSKLIYSDMIYSYELSGTDCCLLLYDQGDIKLNENKYRLLKAKVLSPYTFLIDEIKKLEITPGQLGLDPCSGSIVVTDVDTGDVKAMVTYPSYDNNKLANKVDSKYYNNYLLETKSSPLLNRPTQEKLAPGSTFKMISAVTGLEEGVITPTETIYDKTTFTKIHPSPKDWTIYSHGNINVSQAIRDSCNYFFYEVGYRLGGVNSEGDVMNNRGLEKLKKYAKMFGLTAKSGVEIMEADPQFSVTDIVRSCIGQATHAYTPIQLSRYVTTVANNGTCYNLTLISKIDNYKGKTILDNKAEVRNKVDISNSTWNAIHNGMYMVVNSDNSSIRDYFSSVKEKVAGKTGTAQQTEFHANHAYFVSYAPYASPDVSVTCVIPNGHTSANAANLASDVYKYYFGKKKVSGKVTAKGSNVATD